MAYKLAKVQTYESFVIIKETLILSKEDREESKRGEDI